MSDNYVNVRKVLTEAQKKRLENHKPSVTEENGTLVTNIETINISNKGQKLNKLISVVPAAEEKAVTFDEGKFLFRDLIQVNAMLTNACNLSCSYCYEQHNKDFGRFTVESLKNLYDWLQNMNNGKKKVFQFFGGEPLIHKKLIRDFIETHDDELASNYKDYRGTYISMCTNGLLLDDDFIKFYFGKSYTHMMISLDTLNSAIDHREITPAQLQRVLRSIDKIVEVLKDDAQRLVIRATLSEETSRDMKEFIETLYEHGVRNMVVHPLILDSKRGYLSWKEENWLNMRSQIFGALEKYDDLYIKFSEGVGLKEDSNCMVGSSMVAIDASGDFSGCYFFTNQKSNGADIAVLGNVFQNKIYIDRYKKFQSAYKEMFETEEQCRTCDYQDACYQCPAGNLDTGSKIFRPDDMCQKIVKLYVDFQHDVAKKLFMRHVKKRYTRLTEFGPKVLSAELKYFYDKMNDKAIDDFDHYMSLDLPDHEILIREWASEFKKEAKDLRDLYNVLADQFDKPKINIELTSDFIRCYYIQCISTIIHDTNRINEVKLSTLLG